MKKVFFLFILVLSFNLDVPAQTSNPLATNNAFTVSDSGNNPLRKFNMSSPFTLVSINTANTYFKQSLEFGAPGYLYYLYWPQSFRNVLCRIDTANGTVTQISTTPFVLETTMNFGFSWDRTNNTMYTIFGGGSLYSVNLTNGTFALVNALTPSAHIIGFAVNNSGSMFGYNTLGSKLVKINKTTGVCTDIGSISFPSGDVSGCDFDPLTNKMYILSQNGSNTELYMIDTSTAGKTLVTTFPQKITELAIKGNTFVGIHQSGTEVPSEFSLMQNYPNPFNPVTKIKFQVAKSEFVNIAVYDMLGRKVSILVNEKMSPGNYDVDWNASTFPSGVYIYRMSSGNFIETKTMILVK